MASVDFWIANLSRDPRRLQALERRWSSPLTRAQLANPWQQVRLDGRALPGLWIFRKVKRQLKAQANKKAGADGGNATLRGLLNPNFQLDGQLYVPSHFSAWLEIVPTLDLFGDPKKREQHLIEHPLATLAGVRAVLALEIEYGLPLGGGPLTISLGVLGVNVRDGATKTPTAPPPVPVPSVSLPTGGDARPITPFVVRPPGAAR